MARQIEQEKCGAVIGGEEMGGTGARQMGRKDKEGKKRKCKARRGEVGYSKARTERRGEL